MKFKLLCINLLPKPHWWKKKKTHNNLGIKFKQSNWLTFTMLENQLSKYHGRCHEWWLRDPDGHQLMVLPVIESSFHCFTALQTHSTEGKLTVAIAFKKIYSLFYLIKNESTYIKNRIHLLVVDKTCEVEKVGEYMITEGEKNLCGKTWEI